LRYYDDHLHLATPDRAGLEGFLRHCEEDQSLVGGNLILNTREEVEFYCADPDAIPAQFAIVPYYLAAQELGSDIPRCSGWYKVHPRLRHLHLRDIPGVVQDLKAIDPPLCGVMVDCFPWGPDLREDISLQLVIAIASAFPTTPVLAAHGGGYQAWAFRAHTVSLKNTHYDFAASLSYYVGSDALRPMQNYLRFVPERVLFGSDWPFVDPREQLLECERLGLEIGLQSCRLEAILLANAGRLWPSPAWRVETNESL
jgi:hypothetical protein